MAVSLNKFFGHNSELDQLPAELRAILSQMRQERAAFEALHTRAQESSQQLNQIVQPLDEARRSVSEVQSRVKALERVVPVLATLDEQTEGVAKLQRRMETQLGHSSDDAKRLRGEIQELRGQLEQALALKSELGAFLERGAELNKLRGDADSALTQLREVTQSYDRVRERQEELRRASESAAQRLNALEQRQQDAQGGVVAAEARVAGLERTLTHLTQVAADAAQSARQLGSLKSLTDAVSQKVTAIEQQREVVERASAQMARLLDLDRELEGRMRAQEEGASRLGAMEAKLAELQVAHAAIESGSAQAQAQHEEIRRGDEELRGRLATLRDDVERTVKRFELENQGLDAVSQRILDLRGGLAELEGRVRSLDEASRRISEVQARTEGLRTQLDDVAEDVGELEQQAERVRAIEATAVRLQETVDGVAQRTARLEQSKPVVESVLHDVASLRGTHETVKEALEQLQTAEADLARAREGQAGTKAWLAGVAASVDALREEIEAVEDLRPMVELVKHEAGTLTQSVGELEARRHLVEELNTKLADLAGREAQIEERTHALLGRLNGADERFLALAAHAEEAVRIERLVPAAVATVERVERRVADVDATLASVEARTQNVEGLAERTNALGQELDRRQASLDKATEHLAEASRLREQAATAAQQLEERSERLGSALGTAGSRLGEIMVALDELDGRAGGLRLVQKRMSQFEERLTKWEVLEASLTRGLDQVVERRSTLDALAADMQRLFEMAERTTNDVRAIADAKDEITVTRQTLERIVSLTGDVQEAAGTLDHRKRQIEQAEERLGRVETLLADVQSSLELLHGQKAVVDRVSGTVASLELYAKRAEALIDTLREERNVTDQVREALSQLRQEEVVAKTA
jgi:chromosome segregation ATPase